MLKRIGTGLLPFLLAALPACSGGTAYLRTSDELVAANPMQRIAVITGGQVVYFTSEGHGVDIPWSRQALHRITQNLCDGLQDKGYTVTFCQTAGIGFRGTGAAPLWLYDVDARGRRTLRPDQEHVPLADPLRDEHADIQAAVRRLFTAIEDAAAEERLSAPALPTADVQLLGKVLDADTLCMNRIYGEKRSKGYQRRSRAGAAATKGADKPRVAKSGLIEPSFICVAASSGDVLWQYGASLDAVYTRTSGDRGFSYQDKPLRTMLELFPRPGRTLDAGRPGKLNKCHRNGEVAAS
jgi:hypothetical protein